MTVASHILLTQQGIRGLRHAKPPYLNGGSRISWPVEGAFISRISPDGTRIVAATFASVGAVRPGVSRLDGSHFRRLTIAALPSDADVGPCIWATERALLC